jgi:hypothetical protein
VPPAHSGHSGGVRTLWLLPGLALVAFVLLDATATTLSTTTRAGPMTRAVTTAVWRLGLAAHRRRKAHGPLTAVGPLLLLTGLLQWLALLWAGWTMVFASSRDAVLLAQTGEEARLVDRVYFAGMNLFSLGTGDAVAATPAWRVASVVATATGLFVLTLSLSYFVSVIASATDRRILASRLGALGESPQEIVANAWNGTGFSRELPGVLTALSEPVVRLAEQHVTYHVLHYFHAREPTRSVLVGLARLDEALTLLGHAVHPDVRPDPVLTAYTRANVTRVIDVIGAVHRIVAPEDSPPAPDVAALAAAGVPLGDPRDLAAALDRLADRRRQIGALVASDGWTWDDVIGHGRAREA